MPSSELVEGGLPAMLNGSPRRTRVHHPDGLKGHRRTGHRRPRRRDRKRRAPRHRYPRARPADHAGQAAVKPGDAGELAHEITSLKRESGGDIMAHGGARVVQALWRLGLIDEDRLGDPPSGAEPGAAAGQGTPPPPGPPPPRGRRPPRPPPPSRRPPRTARGPRVPDGRPAGQTPPPRPRIADRVVQAALKLRLAVAQLSVPVRRGLIPMTRIRRIRARIRANPKSGRRWAGPAAG